MTFNTTKGKGGMWGCIDEKEEKKKKMASEGRTTSVARQVSLLTTLKLTLAFNGEGRVDWDPDLRKLLFVQSHHTFR